nr:MAG: RNA-dependent RNA polymerase [Mitovirus sp.]
MDVAYATPFENKEGLREVRYAVGQPMGAYSSWAMLALTHHVIVMVAADNCNLLETEINYAVLGDDMVINNHLVAIEYVNVMKSLGLEISMGKSVISTRFTEFAKKYRGPGVDFSPIGAGAILSAIRSGYMLPSLFMASLGNVLTSPQEILDRVADVPSGLAPRAMLATYLQLVVWQLFGPSTPLSKWAASSGMMRFTMLEHVSGLPKGGNIFEHVKDSLCNLFTAKIRRQLIDAHIPLTYFFLGSFAKLVSGSPFLRVLETLMKPFNPGFWIYFNEALMAPFELDSKLERVFSSFPPHSNELYDVNGYMRAKEIIFILMKESPELSVLTLNFTKAENKVRATFFKDMLKDMNRRFDLSNAYPLNTRWYELEFPTHARDWF